MRMMHDQNQSSSPKPCKKRIAIGFSSAYFLSIAYFLGKYQPLIVFL
jgi:hypothetical protein